LPAKERYRKGISRGRETGKCLKRVNQLIGALKRRRKSGTRGWMKRTGMEKKKIRGVNIGISSWQPRGK